MAKQQMTQQSTLPAAGSPATAQPETSVAPSVAPAATLPPATGRPPWAGKTFAKREPGVFNGAARYQILGQEGEEFRVKRVQPAHSQAVFPVACVNFTELYAESELLDPTQATEAPSMGRFNIVDSKVKPSAPAGRFVLDKN